MVDCYYIQLMPVAKLVNFALQIGQQHAYNLEESRQFFWNHLGLDCQNMRQIQPPLQPPFHNFFSALAFGILTQDCIGQFQQVSPLLYQLIAEQMFLATILRKYQTNIYLVVVPYLLSYNIISLKVYRVFLTLLF